MAARVPLPASWQSKDKAWNRECSSRLLDVRFWCVSSRMADDRNEGAFLAQQRNIVFVGGTGTGKTHLAIAVARACIRGGAHGRFLSTVDFVNRLEGEARNGRQSRTADHLTRIDFVILDELAACPSPKPAGNCSSTWSATSSSGPR